ncbi:hypothetical protein NU688_31370 [Variovorax sp. ZS18.2.2]|uniref:hypothetical protein n=1 Tax=Variovorax sp. ZS18.2.2 TaxID=2971255 RepID=UPI00215146FC|nr:hypothetical protein [Variovorax sp. ZS18.2.2]MCR6480691.1 hypothetical protein [Variovorax sp. ZS18.2.2]
MKRPSREVVTRSPKRMVGILNCRWFQPTAIHHESRLEKHFVLRTMLSPLVRSIQHQPFTLNLGDSRSYTPDFLLTFSNGQSAVVEVTRSERIPALKERFNEITRRLAADSQIFFVVHQGQIEGQRRAERAALLRRYAMLQPKEGAIDAIAAYVASKPKGVSIGALMKHCAATPEIIFHAIARRRIVTVRQLLISKDDLVFTPTQEISNVVAQFGAWFGCSPWKPHVGTDPLARGQQDSV